MKLYYSWSVDGTQAEELQATIMIHDGDIEELNAEYIGEFTMFFTDEKQIKDFLLAGLKELGEFEEMKDYLLDLRDGEE